MKLAPEMTPSDVPQREAGSPEATSDVTALPAVSTNTCRYGIEYKMTSLLMLKRSPLQRKEAAYGLNTISFGMVRLSAQLLGFFGALYKKTNRMPCFMFGFDIRGRSNLRMVEKEPCCPLRTGVKIGVKRCRESLGHARYHVSVSLNLRGALEAR